MNDIAIVKINGKQYLARKGERMIVDRLDAKAGNTIDLKEVLLVSQGTTTTVGTPTVKDAVVRATVRAHLRGKKGIAFRYARKKRVRKVRGFRADLTELEVTSL